MLLLRRSFIVCACFLTLLSFSFGCRDKKDQVETLRELSENQSGPFSSNRLNLLLKVGTPREFILKEFGKPLDITERPPGLVCLTYECHCSTSELTNEDLLIGFQVVFQSNLVVFWSPVLSAGAPKNPRKTERKETVSRSAIAESEQQKKEIQFFIVSEEPITGGNYIDSDELPQLGYIRSAPDLTITKIEFVEERPDEPTAGKTELIVKLSAGDSRALMRLTEKIIGEKVLIKIGGTPVMAPRIQTPLHTQNLLVTAKTSKETERLFLTLKSMTLP